MEYRLYYPNHLCRYYGTYSVTVGNGTTVTNNNSLSFDGQDDYVELGIISPFDDTKSISLESYSSLMELMKGLYYILRQNGPFNGITRIKFFRQYSTATRWIFAI